MEGESYMWDRYKLVLLYIDRVGFTKRLIVVISSSTFFLLTTGSHTY